MVTPVTFRVFEKINGIISTPTLRDLAVRNGEELNLESSPMERFSAESEPLSSERLMLPSCTLRPSAAEAFSSMVGRNWLTGIKNGAMRTRTIRAPTTIRMMRSLPFMTTSKTTGTGDPPDERGGSHKDYMHRGGGGGLFGLGQGDGCP